MNSLSEVELIVQYLAWHQLFIEEVEICQWITHLFLCTYSPKFT